MSADEAAASEAPGAAIPAVPEPSKEGGAEGVEGTGGDPGCDPGSSGEGIEAAAEGVEAGTTPVAEEAVAEDATAPEKSDFPKVQSAISFVGENGEEIAEQEDSNWTAPKREKSLNSIYKEESYLRYNVTEKYTFAEFELSDFADAFKLCDIMGDSKLTPDQVRQAMSFSGMPQDDKDFIWGLNEVDSEGEGLFDFQKFVDLMALYRRPPLTEPELQETFELLDRDNSGSVDAAELKQLLTCVGHALTKDEAEDMIEEADADGSGEIEFDEFCHVILSTQS